MKRTSAELKRMARENLAGHWGILIGATVLMYVITYAVLMPFYFFTLIGGDSIGALVIYMAACIIIGLAVSVLQAGLQSMYLNIGRKREINLGMMFMQFTKRPDRYIINGLLLVGICILCLGPGYACMIVGVVFHQFLALGISIPLLIAGMVIYMILVIQFGLVQAFLVDHPQMKVLEAYRESAHVMRGNKGRMFYIMLSFIGWSLLAVLSCGIGMLWITPYMMQTTTQFYLEVTGELDRKQEPVIESMIDENV